MRIIDLKHEKRMLNIEIRSSASLSHSYKSLSESVLGEDKRLANIKVWFYGQLKEIAEKALAMIDDPERFNSGNIFIIQKYLKAIEEMNQTIMECARDIDADEDEFALSAMNEMAGFATHFDKLLTEHRNGFSWLKGWLE